MSKIEIRGVYKIFGAHPRRVLEQVQGGLAKDQVLEQTGHTVGLADVNLTVEEGRTFVVMGLSGSGKSTLIRHLNRLIDPTAGEILVDGEDVMAMSRRRLRDFRRHGTAMVFQRFGLLPHHSVLDNVAYGLRIQGVGRREREARAREWIDTVGLTGYESAWPAQLSGGMQQRVGLARALATDPDILLMDEAFSALDPLIRREMQDELMRLQARLHKTIVFITHDLDEALRLGDRIAILRDGRVVQVGGAEEILLGPADDYVASFVRDVNRGRVLTAGAVMAAEPGEPMGDTRPAELLARLEARGDQAAWLVDAEQRPAGRASRAALVQASSEGRGLDSCLEPVVATGQDTALEDLLQLTLDHPGPLAVVDEAGRFTGVLSRERLVRMLTDAPAAVA